MKTLRVVLVAALVSFTMLGFAQTNDVDRPNFDSKYISIVNVKSMSAIDYAIRTQVDPLRFLVNNDGVGFYTISVKVKSHVYKVRGTFDQWKSYFSRKELLIPSETIVKNKGKIE